jgi:hypothetical protein
MRKHTTLQVKSKTTSLADKHYIVVPNDTREVPFQLQGWYRQTPACLKGLCRLEIICTKGKLIELYALQLCAA